MDNYLKTLIAAACLVVIAGGAWYAWSEYQRNAEIADIERGRERARAELFEMAKAKPHERDLVVLFCDTLAHRDDRTTNDLVRNLVRNCRSLGFL